MAQVQGSPRMSYTEYLVFEATAEERHEFHHGELFAIEHFRRGGDGSWRLSDHGPGSRVELDAIGASIAVDEVYERIEEFGGPARSEG